MGTNKNEEGINYPPGKSPWRIKLPPQGDMFFTGVAQPCDGTGVGKTSYVGHRRCTYGWLALLAVKSLLGGMNDHIS